MNTVTPQITDAVTQANVNVLGDAPAMAMAQIYQTLAHSTGILFENAVAAQQQQNALAQAAVAQGIEQLYAIDTAAPGVATGHVGAGPEALHATALHATAAVNAATPSPAQSQSSMYAQIKDAVKFANETTLGNGRAFIHALHASVDEMAAAIEAANRVSQDNMLRTLQTAAYAAAMAAMIRAPEKAGDYATVLEAIKRLG